MKGIRGTDKHALLTDHDRVGHRPTQGGTFSEDIFCAEHEAVTGSLDDIAVRFCRAVYSGGSMTAGGSFKVVGFDPAAIMRFVCSILLRCHYSNRDETRLINLSPYAVELGHVVFDRELARAPHVYVYTAVGGEVDFRELASLAAGETIDQSQRWSFQCGGVAFVTDLGRAKPTFPEEVLMEGRPIKELVFDFDSTPLAAYWRSLLAR